MNTKMVLAPLLAVTLALVMAGAIYTMLPNEDFHYRGDVQGNNVITPEPTLGVFSTAAPQPMAAASMATPIWPMFIIAAVIVSVLVILLFFREKGLDKALNQQHL